MALIVDLGHSQRRQSRVDEVGGRVNTEEGERAGQSGAGGGSGGGQGACPRVSIFRYKQFNESYTDGSLSLRQHLTNLSVL